MIPTHGTMYDVLPQGERDDLGSFYPVPGCHSDPGSRFYREAVVSIDHTNRKSCKLSMESVSASLLDTSSTSIP